MVVSKRRAAARDSVIAGSVWESRMKSDEVKGGIKVFNGGEENPEEGVNNGTRLKRSSMGGPAASGKRKTRRSDNSDGLDKNQIQVARGKSEPQKNSDEQCKELSVSADGIKKSPIQTRKLKTEAGKEIGATVDKFERSPIQARKQRSDVSKGTADLGKELRECGEGAEKISGQLRKSKSDSIKTANQNGKSNVAGSVNGNAENSVQLRKTKSETGRVVENESPNDVDGSAGGIEEIPAEIEKNDLDENCKDFGVCEDKVISSSEDNVSGVICSPESLMPVNGDSDAAADDGTDEGDDNEEDEEEEPDEEIEIEMEDVKEISMQDSEAVAKEPENKKLANESEKKKAVNESEDNKVANEPENKKVVSEPEKKAVNQSVVSEPEKKAVNQSERKKFVNTYKRFQQNKESRPVSAPLPVKQSPPIRRNYQNFIKVNSIPKAEEHHSFPETQNKLQSLVDLIMWRDVSRSAFVFGMGTFITVSSSYAKDINVSFISVMSYLGLVYLAIIFLYRSLICRGIIDVDDTNYALGEEEAIWVLKLFLPYLNEFLSKLRALFSGDPGTTMKLAVLLFVLARCGNSITIWKMAKFGFFGVFTVPKICSSYSAQLTAYGNFWLRRFKDAWESCTHKKAVAIGIFGLVWNLSSVVARVWAVFVLFVAFRYYQQNYLAIEEWVEDEAPCEEETWHEPVGVGVERLRKVNGPNIIAEPNKVKKGF